MPLFFGPQIPDNQFRVVGSADPTKKAALEVDGLTTATTRTLTPQDADYTIAGTNIANTFTEPQAIITLSSIPFGVENGTNTLFAVNSSGHIKCDTQIVIDNSFAGTPSTITAASITAPRTHTLPDITGRFALVNAAQTWSSGIQSFYDSIFKLVDNGDTSKTAVFSLGGASAGADLTMAWSGTGDRTVTIPDSTTTLAGLSTAQTFTAANTIDLATLGAASSNDDIVGAQINAWAETGAGNNDFLRINDTSSLSSSGFTFTLAYTTPTANRRLTFPNATGQIVLTSSTDVLSNKTLAGTGGIRCGTSTATGVKFQNVTSTTQIMMIDLSELTTQRNIKFLNIAGTVALDTNVLVDSSGNILVDSNGDLMLSA